MDRSFWHYPSIDYHKPNITTTATATTTTTTTTTTTVPRDNSITDTTTTTTADHNNHTNHDSGVDEYNADFSQIDYYQNHLSFIESSLSPILCVLDFDHTLAVYDEHYILDEDVTDHLPSVYTRPFLYQLLDYLKSVNKNNVIILWTAGANSYIQQNLLLLNICQYFDHVLSRKHCHESRDKFNVRKSYQYLVETFPQYKNMRSVIIDNYAWCNSANTGYNKTISVKPFTIEDVVKSFGAFNVNPCDIGDLDSFIESKGKTGKEINTRHRTSETYLGDTTLLNLIQYLQKYFFNFNTRSETTTTLPPPEHPLSLRLHALYSIKPDPVSATLRVAEDPNGSGIPVMYSITRRARAVRDEKPGDVLPLSLRVDHLLDGIGG